MKIKLSHALQQIENWDFGSIQDLEKGFITPIVLVPTENFLQLKVSEITKLLNSITENCVGDVLKNGGYPIFKVYGEELLLFFGDKRVAQIFIEQGFGTLLNQEIKVKSFDSFTL